LGGNTQIELPNRAIWLATGNNLEIAGDMARRCYRIALDANLPRPWERSGFAHHDLIGYLAEKRGAMLGALLTLARAWYAADCPVGDVVPMGSFEDWSRIIGGILQHAGIVGFLGNRADLYADTDSQEWETFLSAWYQIYGDKLQSAAEIVTKLQADPKFAATLPGDLQDAYTALNFGKPEKSLTKQLGIALKRVQGRPFGANDDFYKAVLVRDSHRNRNLWHVEKGK
jgi:hypothetical protein